MHHRNMYKYIIEYKQIEEKNVPNCMYLCLIWFCVYYFCDKFKL